MVARRRDHRGLAARPARVPELRGRDVGPRERERADPARRAELAEPLMAASVVEIERDLAELRDASGAPGQGPVQRTSVMTHLAWVPPDWAEAAERTLAGLAEQHPSRTILLFPRPEDDDALDLDASVQCFAFGERAVCAEVIRVQLCGARAHHPASVVVPLLIADLPVFCRWRGMPEFDDVFEEVVGVVDRLIVDSTEWPTDGPPGEPPPPSELLSNQLDRFTRDPVYEAAVRSAAA